MGMSGPVFIEQLTIALMGTVISMMVKGSGLAAVAAVNLLNSLTMLFQQSYTAIGVGVTVVVAQYRGKNDHENTGKAAWESTMLSVYMAGGLAVVCYIFLEPILALILADSEALVYEYGRIYLLYNIISLPFIGVYTVTAAAIRGSGYPKLSLVATLIHNGSYAAMAYVAVFFLNTGITGVSVALLISRVFAAAFGVYLLLKGNENLHVKKFGLKLSRKNMAPVFVVGLPIFLENVLFQFGKLFTQTFAVPYGTAATAANGVGNNLFSLLAVPGVAAANAAPPIVGRYCGMGDKKGAKAKGWQFMGISFVIILLCSLLMLVLLDPLAAYYAEGQTEIEPMIKMITISCCIAVPLLYPTGFVAPAALRASGDSKYTSFISISAMVVMRIGLGYFLTQIFKIGIIGIWIGMYGDWVFRTVFFMQRFISGKWLEMDIFASSNKKQAVVGVDADEASVATEYEDEDAVV